MRIFKKKWAFGWGALLCAVLTAWLMTLCVLNSQNSIRRNGHWFNAQKFLALPGYRSLDTEWARGTLVDNQLDLNSWHGFQMLCTVDRSTPRKVVFEIDKAADTYVDFIFNYNDRQGSGIRIGSDQAFSFEFDFPGKFFKKNPLPNLSDLLKSSNKIQVVQEEGTLFVEIGKKRIPVPGEAFRDGSIGFRGSNKPLAVAQVEIQYQNGRSFFEDFHHNEPGKLFFIKNLIIVILFSLILSAGLICFAGDSFWTLALWRVTRACFVFASLWYVFDFFYLWPQPFPNYVLSQDVPQTIWQSGERARQFFFFEWDRLLGGVDRKSDDWFGSVRSPVFCSTEGRCLGHAENIPRKRAGELRVVLVGGSFFQGGGADSLDHAFYVQLFEKLKNDLGKERPFSLLNLSEAREGDILSYQDIASAIRENSPDVIILEIRSDIFDKPLLQKSLERLATFQTPSLCFTRFIPKKNAVTEAQLSEVFQKSPCVRYESSALLHRLENAAEGFIYVDTIHITGFAQTKFAEWMEPKVLQALRPGD